MKTNRPLLVLLAMAVLPALTFGGVFFGKKQTKVDPAQKVRELLATVKSDGDESRRASAAEELRDYDPAQFPEMVPVLADVVLSDSKVSVRAEAAHTLGKLRPVNQQAGTALEQAAAKDSSLRVRLAAKTALMGYYMAGFKGTPKQPNGAPNTKEPPLADPAVQAPPPQQIPAARSVPPALPVVQPTRAVPAETVEPPLAAPLAPSVTPRPALPLVPTQPPVLQPAPTSGQDGPSLFAPD
jgi:hypothetical protein